MSDPSSSGPTAPPGAECTRHPERPALATCPHCHGNACLFCWHPMIDRCEACLRTEPAAAVPPVPWECRDRPLGRRLGGTLVGAVRPLQTSPAFASDDLRSAVRFALVAALPLAALAGVIPYTQTVLFAPGFQVQWLNQPAALSVAADTLSAMALSVAIFAVYLIVLGVPFASLVRAYGEHRRRHSAVRVMLYRAWLLPLSFLLFNLAMWGVPEEGNPGVAIVSALVLKWLPLLLLLFAMRYTARLAAGVPLFASYLAVVIPYVLWEVLTLPLRKLLPVPWFVPL